MKEGGPPFDADEKMPPEPVVIATVKKDAAQTTLVRGILKELNVPPVKKPTRKRAAAKKAAAQESPLPGDEPPAATSRRRRNPAAG